MTAAAAPLDAEFTRKVALGILSTLQHKGFLSAAEVDAILLAARRASMPAEGGAPGTAPPLAPSQSAENTKPSESSAVASAAPPAFDIEL